MGCGTGCRVGKVSTLWHVLVMREEADSFWTHYESKVPCCSKVLIWAERADGRCSTTLVHENCPSFVATTK